MATIKWQTTQTTATQDVGAGTLHRVIIPTPVALATVKIFDHGSLASGDVLLETVTMPSTLLSSGPVVIEMNVAYSLGITIVTAGATMTVGVVYSG